MLSLKYESLNFLLLKLKVESVLLLDILFVDFNVNFNHVTGQGSF